MAKVDWVLVLCQVMMVVCGIMALRLLVISLIEGWFDMRYFICDEYGWREVPEEIYRRYRGKKLAKASKRDAEEEEDDDRISRNRYGKRM